LFCYKAINLSECYSIVGTLCNFCGTYVLSRNLLFKGLKREITEKLIKNQSNINPIYKFIAERIFGFRGKNKSLLDIFNPLDEFTQHIEKESIFEPIRGIIWIFLGSLLTIIGLIWH